MKYELKKYNLISQKYKATFLRFLLRTFKNNIKNNKHQYKMQKSPKYKSIDTSTIKDRQKYFKNLYDEVNKSKMAVQTITSFKNTELNFKKKIDQIQQELHGTISRINAESKKNVVLKEVITLMKGEMLNFQKTLKKEEEKNESEAQKKIKKVRYDIEQLLQKHNEEIAKINSLKQLASSGRSQRVVFSNLFKKIEKQIKQNEEVYKENLIKSQIAKVKWSNKYGGLTDQFNGQDEVTHQIQNKSVLQHNFGIFPAQNNFFATNDHELAFLTLQKQKSFELEHRKKNIIRESHHSHTHEMKTSSRKFHDLISNYENFIDKMKVHMEFSDLQQGLAFYEGIQEANEKLLLEVEGLQEQINHYEKQIKDIKLQKRRSECYENAKQLPAGSSRRIKLPTEKPIQKQDDFQCHAQILVEISQMLNLPLQRQKFDEEDLRALDSKFDKIIEELKLFCGFYNEPEDEANRATTANSDSNVVDILLDRMDKFNQCEKILDKNLFKQEYVKELGKSKKLRYKKLNEK